MDRSLDEFVHEDPDGEAADPEAESDPTRHETEAGTDANADMASKGGDGTDAGRETSGAVETEQDSGGSHTADEPSLAVHPVESTMDWTPGGAACDACETSVERRWRDDGALVCPDCKRW